jgi:hypothetical protein
MFNLFKCNWYIHSRLPKCNFPIRFNTVSNNCGPNKGRTIHCPFIWSLRDYVKATPPCSPYIFLLQWALRYKSTKSHQGSYTNFSLSLGEIITRAKPRFLLEIIITAPIDNTDINLAYIFNDFSQTYIVVGLGFNLQIITRVGWVMLAGLVKIIIMSGI